MPEPPRCLKMQYIYLLPSLFSLFCVGAHDFLVVLRSYNHSVNSSLLLDFFACNRFFL